MNELLPLVIVIIDAAVNHLSKPKKNYFIAQRRIE
jgi:hypothetical protein